jgi:hypothetical protein
MFNEVFISHAKEDSQVAENLYDYLAQKGYSPWLDKKKIKVGANWDYEIKKALKKSDFVIILLSSTSVRKRSYVQKEFKYAVEYSENKLDDDIYIIPILLDKCQVPESLNKFQWIEIDHENLMEKIFDSLNSQRQKYLDDLSPEIIEINDYTSVSLDLNFNILSKIDYQCDLPFFHKNVFFDAHFVNTFIQQKASDRISGFRKWINADDDFFNERQNNFYFEISHTIKRLDEKNLSLTIFYNSYFGGAHPSISIDTLNFAFKPDRRLDFRDIVFIDGIKYESINVFIKEHSLRYGNEGQKEILESYIRYFTEENINFVFDEKILEIYFTNQVPHIMAGIGTLEIPMNAITTPL